MYRITVLLSVVLISRFRSIGGDDCLTTQTDVGALYLKELQQAIDTAECQLLKDITYTDYKVSNNEQFDFIVVGGGSAGCVLANRLSENPDWNVLLVEAGGDPTISTEIPSLFTYTWNTNIDWQYHTEPEPTNCLGMVDRRCPWPRGKVLGGSSSINAMVYVRGNPKDYDTWESLGNPGWGYKYMLPYFKKSEDLKSKEVLRDIDFSRYHGRGGLLTVDSYNGNLEFLLPTFSRAFKELRFSSFVDINAQHHEGFFHFQSTIENARRCSTAKAFLHDFQCRPNLKISKHSFVRRVLIAENKTAYGVEFTKAGKMFQAIAAKEVILSAGSINTPHLLMLSGIGPTEHLEELGIDVIKDLKVGYNLQDHTRVSGFLISLDIAIPSSNKIDDMFEFLVNSKVGLGSRVRGQWCLKTSKASYPNIQFYFNIFPANSTASLSEFLTTLGLNNAIMLSIFNINSKKTILFIEPALLRPSSRGRLLLRSKNPLNYPLLYSGYFTEQLDIEENLEAIEFANAFTKTPKIDTFGSQNGVP